VFGKNKGPTPEKPPTGKIDTIIGEGTELTGEVKSSGMVRIDGSLNGAIHHDGDLIIGPQARVAANIRARTLVLSGEVRGDVNIEGRLELLPGARLIGDISCGQLIIHLGALFQGRSSMAAVLEEPAGEVAAEVAVAQEPTG